MANQKRKSRTAPVSPKHLSVWDLLQAELDNAPKPRPPNSITVAEFAERTGYGRNFAWTLLKRNPKLQAVPYISNKTRTLCFIPKEETAA